MSQTSIYLSPPLLLLRLLNLRERRMRSKEPCAFLELFNIIIFQLKSKFQSPNLHVTILDSYFFIKYTRGKSTSCILNFTFIKFKLNVSCTYYARYFAIVNICFHCFSVNKNFWVFWSVYV